MFATLFRSDSDLQLRVNLCSLILRLSLALIFIYHGLDKITEGSGGGAWVTQMYERDPSLHFPGTLSYAGVQFAVAWGEFLGGLALLAGMFTRLAALGEIVIQLGAIMLVTAPRGFPFERGGAEYNLVLVGMCLALFVLGPGYWSLDWKVRHQPRHRAATPAAAGTAPPLGAPHLAATGQPAEPLAPGQAPIR